MLLPVLPSYPICVRRCTVWPSRTVNAAMWPYTEIQPLPWTMRMWSPYPYEL